MRVELTLAFLLREWLLPIERPERGMCTLVKCTCLPVMYFPCGV